MRGSLEFDAALYLAALSSLFVVLAGLAVLPRTIQKAMPGLILLGYLYVGVAIRPLLVALTDLRLPFGAEHLLDEASLLIRATWLGTMGALSVLAATFLWTSMRLWSPQRSISTPSQARSAQIASILAWMLVILIPLLNWLPLHLGIGVHGGRPSELPYRLGGVLVIARGHLGAVILLQLLLAYRSRRRSLVWLGYILLGLNTVAVVMTTSSRGVLIGTVLELTILLFYTLPRMPLRRMALVVTAVVVLSVWLWPVLTAYRSVGGPTRGIITGLRMSLEFLITGGQIEYDLGASFRAILNRFTGVEMVVPVIDYGVILGPREAWAVMRQEGLVLYYNRAILRVPPESRTGFGPSIIGWLFLVGGATAVAAGMFVLTLSCYALWRLLHQMALVARPLILAVISNSILNLLIDGNVDDFLSIKGLPALLFICVAAELVARTTVPQAQRVNRDPDEDLLRPTRPSLS